MLSPRAEALAFRIWAYCEPKGWDVTVNDVARDLCVHPPSVGNVARYKGWLERFRANVNRSAERSRISDACFLETELPTAVDV